MRASRDRRRFCGGQWRCQRLWQRYRRVVGGQVGRHHGYNRVETVEIGDGAAETLRIIALPALAIAMVGLLESVLTAAVVDEMTETPSDKNRECSGLGLANMAASLFGGIAGCGMIGQAVGNVKYGGRGRLSTLFAGVFLLLLMVLLKPWVSQVPVIALVAIMVMVSASTFDWKSLGQLLRRWRLTAPGGPPSRPTGSRGRARG